ncbi:pseudouridine synthase [Desulfohalovibrio reitneri]|uniref:pseudouridine synthase n=1 Tax=Desulfohalovibrio reitneri TaxID=1307759 RepID=UPI0004A6C7A1|nr:pseudouridine synthase [Desulfohalovibrio reitneri]
MAATRLNKAIAQSGVCSRRKADELVFAGRVYVDGEKVTEPGRRVDPARSRIEVDGALLPSPAEEHAYLMLHKPVRTVTTAKDPQGRTTVLDLLPEKWNGRRLVPVGRLDFFSEGLLLLTDDGELTNRMTHPRYHLPKVYQLRVLGNVDKHGVQTIRQGMRLSDGTDLSPVEAEIVKRDRDETELRLVLRQGVNRQIRRMCDDLGWAVLRLRRVAQGPLELGKLPPGEIRSLDGGEVAALKKSVGLG